MSVRTEKNPSLEFDIDLQEGWQTAFEGITSVESIQDLPAGLKETMHDLLDSIDDMVIDAALDAEPLKVNINSAWATTRWTSRLWIRPIWRLARRLSAATRMRP